MKEFERDTLKVARVRAGFSQEEVAEKMNVSKQTVSNWETGKHSLTVNKAKELAALYGTTIYHLQF